MTLATVYIHVHVCTAAVLVILLPLCLCASSNISLLVVVDQVENDPVIAAVERTIDIINSNNDTLPEHLLQYTTDNQVYNIPQSNCL